MTVFTAAEQRFVAYVISWLKLLFSRNKDELYIVASIIIFIVLVSKIFQFFLQQDARQLKQKYVWRSWLISMLVVLNNFRKNLWSVLLLLLLMMMMMMMMMMLNNTLLIVILNASPLSPRCFGLADCRSKNRFRRSVCPSFCLSVCLSVSSLITDGSVSTPSILHVHFLNSFVAVSACHYTGMPSESNDVW